MATAIVQQRGRKTAARKSGQRGANIISMEAARLRLVPTTQQVSQDTVESLEALLDRARRGEVIGVAYAAMYRCREFRVHTCGEMVHNPTFARGAVAALNDQVSRKQWGER